MTRDIGTVIGEVLIACDELFPGRGYTVWANHDENETFVSIDGDVGNDEDWRNLVEVHGRVEDAGDCGVRIVMVEGGERI